MRQVPYYLLIGNGRVAKHFRHYFSLLNLSFHTWSRTESLLELQRKVNISSHILLLISDNAIERFIRENLNEDGNKPFIIHFSGSLVTDLAYGIHPLMTFTEQLYYLEDYQAIPFVIDHDAPGFSTLLPGLLNSHARLDKSLKAKYHALCVLSGNFSCILWQKFFLSLEQEFNLPCEIAFPYLQQQTKNLLSNPKSALTGPLVRNDVVTLEKNLNALSDDRFKKVYESFIVSYQAGEVTK